MKKINEKIIKKIKGEGEGYVHHVYVTHDQYVVTLSPYRIVLSVFPDNRIQFVLENRDQEIVRDENFNLDELDGYLKNTLRA